MPDKVFVDTNVFVYARDVSSDAKQPQAQYWLERLWKTSAGCTSYQVLNEYFVTVTQKLRPGMSRPEAWEDVRDLFAWSPQEVNRPVLELAFHLVSRLSLSWWDALVFSAARLQSCRYLLSEDLQAGLEFDGTTVINPFVQSPENVLIPE